LPLASAEAHRRRVYWEKGTPQIHESNLRLDSDVRIKKKVTNTSLPGLQNAINWVASTMDIYSSQFWRPGYSRSRWQLT
jgi:hypothetical protein